MCKLHGKFACKLNRGLVLYLVRSIQVGFVIDEPSGCYSLIRFDGNDERGEPMAIGVVDVKTRECFQILKQRDVPFGCCNVDKIVALRVSSLDTNTARETTFHAFNIPVTSRDPDNFMRWWF